VTYVHRDNIDRVGEPTSNVTRRWKEKENKIYYLSLSNNVALVADCRPHIRRWNLLYNSYKQ